MGNHDDGASGEDRLIGRYFRPIATHPGALGLIDDAACLSAPPGHDLVFTADALVAGVHFFADDPPDLIARKALRVNLSDLAAKGAAPLAFLMTIALPSGLDADWLARFARGLGEDARDYDCSLLGGDTVRTSGPACISITAIGTVPAGRMVQRRGAKPGDLVMVSGTIGDAALGLSRRRQGAELTDFLVDRYLLPRPRTPLAEALRDAATAAMDVSDGLAGDLAKLCRASGVSAQVDAARVPLSDSAASALANEPALIEAILSGGDDYEIVASVPPQSAEGFIRAGGAAGVTVTAIGRVASGEGDVEIRDATGRRLTFARGSFSHF